jgi:hypothetical protein
MGGKVVISVFPGDRLVICRYENDLHAAQDEGSHVDGHEALISGSVYTDINRER